MGASEAGSLWAFSLGSKDPLTMLFDVINIGIDPFLQISYTPP